METKVVILCGGLGTRLEEETVNIPKPMVQIGPKPILWHIMKIFSYYGFNDFILCLGYKGYVIKEYFANYFMHNSDITIDLKDNSMKIHRSQVEPWRITLLDTGLDTKTGGRIRRIEDYVQDQTFFMTYGDGVGDINIKQLLNFHRKHRKYATLTAVQPSGRFGVLGLDSKDAVTSFQEKPEKSHGWINGGFFVLEPQVFKYIKDDNTQWEKEPLGNLSVHKQLVAYKHYGFWRPMDTIRDKRDLETMWLSGNAPWKLEK